MPIIDDNILCHARTLWDYHYLDVGMRPADFILALGSHDERVAVYGANLILEGFAPLLVLSGALGKVTKEIWRVTEGERFAQIARSAGVPDCMILIENTATNIGENITRTRDLLPREGISVHSGILVTKPYMRRRAHATATKQWPEIEWMVSSPSLSFDEYLDDSTTEQTIELMVGDLQRIKVYAEQGFQTPQDIPAKVWNSYEELVRLGFDKYVIS